MRPSATALFLAMLAASTAAVAAPPSSLAVGQEVRGEITSADTLNWRDGSRSELYAIQLSADQAVRFQVEGPLRAQLSLFRGEELVQASDAMRENASLVARPQRAGRYVLAVSGADAGAYGPYTLSATPMEVYGGGEIVPGATITDWSQSPRQIPLRISEAGLYRIRMASEDFDTVLGLEGNGYALRSDDADGSNSVLTVRLEPGVYTLVATGFQDMIDGQFELSVAPHVLPDGVEPAAAGDLEAGRELTALYQGEPVEYRLVVPRRQLLQLDMRSSEIDPGLTLRGNGLELEDDDSGDRLDARIVTVVEPGEYTVRAGAYDAGAGVFTLSAELSEVPADAGGGALQVGRARDARLLPGAADRYTFTVARAGRYLVEMSSDDVDSHLRLFRDGGEIASDDDGGGALNARIEEQLAPGDYVLEASSALGGEGGRYRIGVQRR